MIPRPPSGTPIRVLERLWLDTACLYEEFHETVMADTDWDLMAKELNDRREEWSPYFHWCLPSREYNPGTTASGIDWSKGIPRLVYDTLKALDGNYQPVIDKHLNALGLGALE